MAEEISPDLGFIKDIIAWGGDSLKKCFQCATCAVICPLSTDTKPFPRKEMIWAQWGLMDKLVGNPDIWLCHQCNDCSLHCPRGAKPGDVLASVRRYSFMNYAFPRFMGRLLSDIRNLPYLLALPMIIFIILLASIGHLNIPEGEIVFSRFFPIFYIDVVFITVSLLALLSAGIGISNFWKGMERNSNPWMPGTGMGLIPSIISTVTQVLGHNKFKDCGVNKDRYRAHLLVFYGFVGLFITTNIILVLVDFLHIETPLPFIHPAKILGNVSGIAVLVGITLVLLNRLKNKDITIATSYDWVFIWMIYALVISGILTEVTRLAGIPFLAYPIYLIHLVVVFYIIGYLPYSKLAHLLYRSVAMVYSRYSGREGIII
ncbi:MAG: quinone-interacting membrane-bound oxidoreductase complex subunit QmoC [Nitrospinae bacterium]|nr:quinone-interacting membrane-bound oxidoreductase complex subunit QmoC [Nitrospinota bacterium]